MILFNCLSFFSSYCAMFFFVEYAWFFLASNCESIVLVLDDVATAVFFFLATSKIDCSIAIWSSSQILSKIDPFLNSITNLSLMLPSSCTPNLQLLALLLIRVNHLLILFPVASIRRILFFLWRSTLLMQTVFRNHHCVTTYPCEPITNYCLLTVIYGTAAALYLALRVLDQLVDDESIEFLTVPILHQTIYWYIDCTFGADDKFFLIKERSIDKVTKKRRLSPSKMGKY